MTAALTLGLLLLAQAPPAAPTASPPAPAPAAPPDNPALDADQLQQMYRDTCLAREYGAYDDMCDQLRQQVQAAAREAARAARSHAKSPPPQPVSVSPPP